MLNIEIDPGAGFCFGVVKAISKAEFAINDSKEIYCLGEIVHNSEESNRLQNKGLKFIDHEKFKELKNKKVLIRAHGEPPSTYMLAAENNIEIIEGTCPIVIKLQERIKKFININPNYQVVIYGKAEHPEVIGLAGQVNDVVVIRDKSEIHKISYNKPIYFVSQTTMDKHEFFQLADEIKQLLPRKNMTTEDLVVCQHSICGHVQNRKPAIKPFLERNDLIIFVAGKNSSNGKKLYAHCKTIQHNTKFISHSKELQKDWFKGITNVGISGATSTPQWLLNEVKDAILGL